jgi:hypothetical protein
VDRGGAPPPGRASGARAGQRALREGDRDQAVSAWKIAVAVVLALLAVAIPVLFFYLRSLGEQGRLPW